MCAMLIIGIIKKLQDFSLQRQTFIKNYQKFGNITLWNLWNYYYYWSFHRRI